MSRHLWTRERQRRANAEVAPPGPPVGDLPVDDGGLLAWIARQFVAAGARGWAWRSLAIASVVSVVVYVLWYATWGGQEVDLGVYLMGASHVTSAQLYSLRSAHLGLYFTYTPFAAAVFTPLTIFPMRVAEGIWGVVNVVALVAILYATIRAIHPAGRRGGARWTAMLLAGPCLGMEPVLSTLSFGQVNLVLAAFVLVDLTSIRRFGGPLSRRGVLVGVAAAVKLTPLIFVPWLFLTRQARAGWTAIWTFLACAAVGFAITPRSSALWWSKDVFKTSRVGGVAFITNQDLRVVIERFHHALVSGAGISVLIALVAVAGLGLAVLAYRRSSELLGVLVCAVTGLVVSPVTWSHHLVWVVPVVLWLAVGTDRPRYGPLVAFLASLLFWIAPIDLVPRRHNRELHLHGLQLVAGDSFFFAMALFLLGMAAMLLWRSRRSHQRAEAGRRRDVLVVAGIDPSSGGAVPTSA